MKRIRLWLRALFLRARTESEMKEEMLFHLDQQTRLYMQQGMPRDEARRAAGIMFGGVAQVEELQRDGRGTRGVEEILADVRYAIRSLWRDRALTVAGVATLALGIGATTAVFSAVNAVMLRDLPFRDSDRLVAVWEENTERGWHKAQVAPANYLSWRERVAGFGGDLAAYNDFPNPVTLLGRGEPVLLNSSDVTGNFLSVLGVTPQFGRGFAPDDDWENGRRPILISGRLWRSHFNADPGVIGTSVSLGGRGPWQIVGVMPDGFAFPSPSVDVWKPMLWNREVQTQAFFRRGHWARVVGRLKPGVTIEAANAELATVARQLEKEFPATNQKMYAGITPIREWIVRSIKRPLVVLLSAAAVLLLIACANVGNLLLVHAVGRARDVSLRFVLGATQQRVAQQAITESLVLSAAGGLAGFALGWAGARSLLTLQPDGMLPVPNVAVDYRVLAFAVVITTLSGLVFGLAPAFISARQSPADALNAGGRTFTSGIVRRWGRQLVVVEVALAVLLTVSAGLLVRSYDRLSSVAPGFDPSGVLTVTLGIPASRYDSASKVVNFYSTLLERVRALPGVERVAAVRQLPVTGGSWSSGLSIKGRPTFDLSFGVLHREVHDDYFRVMRVPLLQGRAFDETDRPGAPLVVVVNEAFTKRYFPNGSPIGHQITNDREPSATSVWRTIVGVVGSEHQEGLATSSRPEVFAPFAQDWTRGMSLVIRMQAGHDPLALATPVRRTIRDLDSLLAISALRPMTDVHAAATARERFISMLVLVFAVSGIALALVGVFGVLAQQVQARWRELGIRLALGAQRGEVRWMVVRNGLALVGAGIAAGLLISLGVTRLLATLLFAVSTTDPLTYAGVALLIALVGAVAAAIPAWRASTANPANTLRAD